jgi:hypothetical protein
MFEKHILSEFEHSSKCAAKTSYGLTCSERSSLKIHICSDDAERETLLAISLGQLSLKTFRLPSGVESVSQRFGQTSIPSVLMILLSGAIPVPSLQIRSAG